MSQTAIPYLFMRGGSSRGPYFNRADLPQDRDVLAEVLLSVLGSGHPLNIDGIGGGAAVTTKVAMLSRSDDPRADVDYFFAQVSVEDRLVDFKPTCGNILSAVGPAAIEMGLVKPTGDETAVRIKAVNTGARIEARVCTPGGDVTYEGAMAIDGVPGTAAPVGLAFMDVAGSATGAMLPTGELRETIEGIEVTCMDVAMPMMIARAEAFGLTGYETRAELDANRPFFDQMEQVRRAAGARMGMGDISRSVMPKVGLLAPAREGGTLCARYFMPWATHPGMAVTGAQCLAACALTPGTVADGLLARPDATPVTVTLEHPGGSIDVVMDIRPDGEKIEVISAGLVRTARKLAAGSVFVPSAIWAG